MQTRSMKKQPEYKSHEELITPKVIKKQTLSDIKSSLGIDENLTKVRNNKKMFSKVKDNIPQHEDYNFMADTMYMPTDKFGYKYILVMTDLASREFDMQEMKNRDPEAIMNAMDKMFKREYLNKPEYTITTDGGSEFKGILKKWMYDESIYHKITLPGRHKQLGNIDNLINQLNGLFNGLMNKIERKTGKVSKTWVKYIPQLRDMLNASRKVDLDDEYDYPIPQTHDKKGKLIKPKFKVGDKVHVLLDRPQNALGETQTGKFRTGDNRYDMHDREIKQVFVYSGDVLYRYMVKGIKNVSYTENEIIKA